MVDLHSLIVPSAAANSVATGIDSAGNIIGYTFTQPFAFYAVLWTPVVVPEPATETLLIFGLAPATALPVRLAAVLICYGRRSAAH